MRIICTIFSILALAEVTRARPQNVQGQQPNIVALPYYGGAKGQILQITKDRNGGILNQAIVPESPNTIQQIKNTEMQRFANNLYNIQSSAQRLVELQEKTKKLGQLKADDQQVYASNLAILGESASNLAQLGGVGTGHDFSRLFLEGKKGNKKGSKKENIRQEQQFEEDDTEDVGEQQEENGSSQSTDTDGIVVNGPSDSASVAEAKPVGVAIAGDGGVASSKPVATAVVGPGGLAIARPVATAIAGVDPSMVGLSNKIPLVAKTGMEGIQALESQPIQYYQYPYQYYQMPSAYPPINFAIY